MDSKAKATASSAKAAEAKAAPSIGKQTESKGDAKGDGKGQPSTATAARENKVVAGVPTAAGGRVRKTRLLPPRGRKSALVVVDMQNDFLLPTGSMTVAGALAAIPVINQLRAKVGFELIAVSADWHPAGHASFCSSHVDRVDTKIGSVLLLDNGTQQMMYPDHCLQNSNGAAFHTSLTTEATDFLIRKGQHPHGDSTSVFWDCDGEHRSDLLNVLRTANVTDVYFCGVRLEGVVRTSALESVALGFDTFVVADAVGGATDDVAARTIQKLEQSKVTVFNSRLLFEERPDRRTDAADYLKRNNINALFERLTTALVYHRPDDPRAFLLKELQKIQQSQQGNLQQISSLALFTPGDFDTLFNMMDPLNRGTLTTSQVLKALSDLGVLKDSVVDELTKSSKKTYTKDEFRAVALSASMQD